MGKIVELFPGREGKFRVAKFKVKGNHIIRPLQYLYLLEAGQLCEPQEIPLMKNIPKVKTLKLFEPDGKGRLVYKPNRFH